MSPPSSHPHAVAICRAVSADADTLSRLGRETFVETWVEGYAMPYAPADVAAFCDETWNPALISRRLADRAHAYWLAQRAGEPVGYALAGPCTLPVPGVAPGDGELKQLYLHRIAQGSGAGSALLDAALTWLERDGPRRLWIGVWSGNTGAQRLYARHGFRKAGEHTFTVGATIDREFNLVREAETQP